MSQYNFQAARKKEQLKRMLDLEKRNVCAFCSENITKETTSPVEIETKYWFVKDNDFPYEGTKYHFLLIPKQHARTVSELSKAAMEEFLNVVSLVEKKYKLKSYGVGIRSGDMRFNGGSVEHLHAQLIVGDITNHRHVPVRMKFSSMPK